MAYQVLARKYRPLRFSDVVGQDHVTRTLQNALEQGRIAHGYIFSGHRGIGKTTIARILASALNCQRAIGSPERPTPEPCLRCDSCLEVRQGNAVDVIEIDAATNRGIDEIRELRDAARYRPARDRYKIYILDEAHQITDAAFNALLKTLEEPPDHIVFMLATTEPENIPQTIRSRCQHFSFHAVKLQDILGQLQKIAADENVLADPAALDLLAEAGDGSMRDALSIMDQAIASAPTVPSGPNQGKPELSATEIRDLMGSVPNTVFEEILEHVNANQAAGVLITANRLLDAGNSPAQIARQFVRYLRNCVVAKIANLTPDAPDTDLLQISPDERRRAARSAALFTEEELTRFLQVILRTFDDLGFRQEQRFHLELGLLKLVHLQRLLPMEHFLSQLPRPTPAIPRPPRPEPATPRVPHPEPATPRVPHVSPLRQVIQPPPTSQDATNPAASPAPGTASPPPAPVTETAPHPPEPVNNPSSQPERSTPEKPATLQSATPRVPHVSPLRHGIQPPPTSQGATTPEVSPNPETPPSNEPSSTPSNRTTESGAPGSAKLNLGVSADTPAPGPTPEPAAPHLPPVSPLKQELNPLQTQTEPNKQPANLPTVSLFQAQPNKQPANVPTLAQPSAPSPTDPSTGRNAHLPQSPEPSDTPHIYPQTTEPVNLPNADPETTNPASTPEPTGEAAALQAAAVEALFAAKTHNSAAEQLAETTWTLTDGELRIQTALSKPLLATLFRPDVEAIIKGALRNQGVTGLKLVFLPGNLDTKPKTPRKPRTGSAQARAQDHPTVQAAQKLFNAEITTVYDLRRD